MQPEIMARLNAINAEFYRVTATEFDQTRGQAWQGWSPLRPYLHRLTQPFSVFDVGCGNGRFGVFLAEEGYAVNYHGTDNNPALLQFAHEALRPLSQLTVTLTEHDSITQPLPDGGYDVVVLFGVIHHVPGYAHRLAFMRQLAQRVNTGGLLVFASWRFYEFERFRERVVAWDDELAPHVEANDYLLDWRRGDRALRYCHYVDDTEHQALIDATQLSLLTSYRADGYNGLVNAYSILQA